MFTSDHLFGEDITILPMDKRPAARNGTPTVPQPAIVADTPALLNRVRLVVAAGLAALALIVLFVSNPAQANTGSCSAAVHQCAIKAERIDARLGRSISRCHAIRACDLVCNLNAREARKRDCAWSCGRTYQTRACTRASGNIRDFALREVDACAAASACIGGAATPSR